MIRRGGEQYGTAAEIGRALGVRPHVVRNWARPDREALPAVRMRDATGRPEVRYPLSRAAEIERAKRTSGLGRPRAAATA